MYGLLCAVCVCVYLCLVGSADERTYMCHTRTFMCPAFSGLLFYFMLACNFAEVQAPLFTVLVYLFTLILSTLCCNLNVLPGNQCVTS